MIWFC